MYGTQAVTFLQILPASISVYCCKTKIFNFNWPTTGRKVCRLAPTYLVKLLVKQQTYVILILLSYLGPETHFTAMEDSTGGWMVKRFQAIQKLLFGHIQKIESEV